MLKIVNGVQLLAQALMGKWHLSDIKSSLGSDCCIRVNQVSELFKSRQHKSKQWHGHVKRYPTLNYLLRFLEIFTDNVFQ